jgi:hypothetical protein
MPLSFMSLTHSSNAFAFGGHALAGLPQGSYDSVSQPCNEEKYISGIAAVLPVRTDSNRFIRCDRTRDSSAP